MQGQLGADYGSERDELVSFSRVSQQRFLSHAATGAKTGARMLTRSRRDPGADPASGVPCSLVADGMEGPALGCVAGLVVSMTEVALKASCAC